MKSDKEKGAEIIRKRRLAAKGLEERGDDKPVDPLADAESLHPDDKRLDVDPLAEPEPNVAVAAALGRARWAAVARPVSPGGRAGCPSPVHALRACGRRPTFRCPIPAA